MRRPCHRRSHPRQPFPAGRPARGRCAALASCALLAACATGARPPGAAPAAFELASPVRELAASASASGPVPPPRALRAYALRIHTVGAGPQTRVDVLGRHARLPGGALVAITGSQGAGIFGMTRSIGLCGLVSLRLDTALADRAYLPGDPARIDDIRFTDQASLEIDTRMQVTELEVEGTPCAPRPAAGFTLVLQTRHAIAARGMADAQAAAERPALAGEVRYECRAASAFEPASRLHPDLPGDMLRVDCRRGASAAAAGGYLAYAWIASSGVYLLTGHRGQDIAQHYVYTDVVLGP